MQLNSTAELIEDIRQGKMVILMDDEDRENEGDLILAASCVTPEAINFMAKHARGLICLTLTKARCRQLNLPLMVRDNQTPYTTNFTLSIEAAEGVTTGISAQDRARTVQAAVAADACPEDLVQPGHIFPLMAQPGGVLSRAGHTEAGCDLARLAGFEAAAVIVEIMNEDGTMARRKDLEAFASAHGIKIGTIADLIHYRVVNETTVEAGETHQVETEYGPFNVHTFYDRIQNTTHLAFVLGELDAQEPTWVRVHLADPLRDLLALKKEGRANWSMRRALQEIAERGQGVVVLLTDTGRVPNLGELLAQHVQSTRPQRTSARDGSGAYLTVGTGSQILRELGVGKMRLLSSPMKFSALSGFGLEVVETLACEE
ncbi:3,4-dihydroxy 2-butanone 4-phosphate synthase / GTP cyclohydrolase II [Allopseudospirillum japonicum]|uniref:3,4-dihydroxy-2-butanone 4-phosphate synthase n=1 Tax=Allopseudospirillum japonicum TaxID=64971 RepID=A0A1H6UC44_9GAMM|nr:bifunctional 3,4-dihydroxy-2-butanone-4-phosphate synthase/GTP cyclohydrolase II [Allopseudospirillum japonicum]SEI88214.1 3,4-dihydroxy 2-butanone 4-phosphate synthase / GTP cyclohydrolase II [Allopseudospirillum japonicum]